MMSRVSRLLGMLAVLVLGCADDPSGNGSTTDGTESDGSTSSVGGIRERVDRRWRGHERWRSHGLRRYG